MKTVCCGALYTVGATQGELNSPVLSLAKGISAQTASEITFVGGTGADSYITLPDLHKAYPSFDFSKIKERIEHTPVIDHEKDLMMLLRALGAVGYLSPSSDEVAVAAEGADLLCVDFWCEREWIRNLVELKKKTGCRIAWHIAWARSVEDLVAAEDSVDVLILNKKEADKLLQIPNFSSKKLLILDDETESSYYQAGKQIVERIGEHL